jgi:Protein of unknown function (DUF3987)
MLGELMVVKPWDIDPVNYPPPPPPPHDDDPPPRGNGGAGNGHDHHDSYPHGEQERGRQTNAFVYQAADGKPYLQVRKFEWIDKDGKRKKAFPQYHRENGRWIKGKPAGPRIPYHLPALLAAAPDAWIDIMEGEKDADRGAELGLATTTNPEGAEKWHEELNEYFRGSRVRLHEDNDAAGRAHVAKTTSMLCDVAKGITVVRYPEQKEGGDFSDFMNNGGTLEAMVARARPYDQEAPKIIPIDLWAKFDPPRLPRGVLPKVIEQFAFEQGDLMGADPAGLAVAALAVCGAAIPDQIELQVKEHDPSWREAARLWIALIADPSSKKSPILRQAARPLNRIDAELARKYAQEMTAYSQLSADERKTTEPPKKRRMRIEDATIEAAQHILKDSPDGVLSLQDELSGWFGAMEKYTHSGRGAGKDRGFWLQSWNGGAYVCDRVGRGTVYIPNLSVSLLGGIQPVAMRKIIDDTVDDGLIQRVIPVMLRPATVSRDEARPDAVATYETTVAWLAGKLDMGARLPALIQFSPEAHVIRRKLEQRHLDLMTCESFNAKLGAHLGKYDGYFARLCLTWHCLEADVSAFISEEIALRVEKFLHGFLLPHAVAFYTSMKGEDQDRLADVAGYILAHSLETITNRDLARCVRSTKGLTAFEVKEVFDALDALGWLTPIPGPRPSSPTRWDVNPECHHRFATRAKAERVRRGKVREMVQKIFIEQKEN